VCERKREREREFVCVRVQNVHKFSNITPYMFKAISFFLHNINKDNSRSIFLLKGVLSFNKMKAFYALESNNC